VYTDTAAAGDVNGDHVIDIYDAKLIVNNAGISGDRLKEDLNKDGVVDIIDFNFVEKNFMSINPYFPTSNKPGEKTKNLTLEELKKTLIDYSCTSGLFQHRNSLRNNFRYVG
jgi:Dockerin type I domain